ncbi:MAG: acyl-CoA dehydrogenase family protein [Solirubrobacteraceae bacterium]
MRRRVYGPEHERFRAHVRGFFEEHVVPEYADWERAGLPPGEFWAAAGEAGLLGIGVPVEYGGLEGSTFKHSALVAEESQRHALAMGGLRVHTDICMPYFLEYATEEQKHRWLPGLTSGRYVTAIAITEPGAGSDMKAMSTRAARDGDHYVVDGAKTFITNGFSANLMIVCVKTDPAAGRQGISLLIVDTDTPGFERGRKLEKIGLRTQDLAELSFTEMVVPCANLLGDENRGFEYLTSNLAQERLSIALNAQAAAAFTVARTVEYVKAASGPNGLAGSQLTKFTLASCQTEVDAGQALADQALDAHVAGELTPSDAASLKLYATELQGRVTDRCVQLLGLNGYSRSTPIGRAFADARVSRIYGGSSEIMKVIVAKAIGL